MASASLIRLALVVALSAFWGAPVEAQDGPASPAPADTGVNCVLESECLPGMAGIARRDEGDLVLSLADGSKKVLRDNKEACADPGVDGCITYVLTAYRPASGLFLVDFQGHETGGVLAIDIQDGSSFELATQPVFSPSGQRLVTTDGMDGRGYDVTIWSRYQGRWIDQLRQSPQEQSPDLWGVPRWTDEDLVTVPISGGGLAKGDAKLQWDGQGWQIQMPPPGR